MSAPGRAALRLRRLGLSTLLLGMVAAAQPVSRLRTDRSIVPPKPPAQDAGPAKDIGALSAEDREVVENLELLENLEQSDNLDLLVELSKED